jgi:hypothetical protein
MEQARSMRARIAGFLLGRHMSPEGEASGEIVQVTSAARPAGPAENAFVYVDFKGGPTPRARYISWINLYDIENADRREPGRWALVEPRERREIEAEWLPFGWSGPRLPSIADVLG